MFHNYVMHNNTLLLNYSTRTSEISKKINDISWQVSMILSWAEHTFVIMYKYLDPFNGTCRCYIPSCCRYIECMRNEPRKGQTCVGIYVPPAIELDIS